MGCEGGAGDRTCGPLREGITVADNLGTVCVKIGYIAARAYLDRHGLKADEDALIACVKSHCKAVVRQAADDAREAFACGMDKIAEETFKASMILAGVEAAKEAGF